MKMKSLLHGCTIAVFLLSVFPGIGTAQMPDDFQDSVVDSVSLGADKSGLIDYTSQVLTANGIGVPVPGQPAAQAARVQTGEQVSEPLGLGPGIGVPDDEALRGHQRQAEVQDDDANHEPAARRHHCSIMTRSAPIS